MIEAIMISPILFTTSNNFRVIIPNNIFQEKQKVWSGKNHTVNSIKIEMSHKKFSGRFIPTTMKNSVANSMWQTMK